MQIETILNVGDEAACLDQNTIQNVTVKEIAIGVNKAWADMQRKEIVVATIVYKVINELEGNTFCVPEQRIAATKKDLLAKL